MNWIFMQISPLLDGIKSEQKLPNGIYTRKDGMEKTHFQKSEDNCRMVMFIAFLCQSEMCRVRYEKKLCEPFSSSIYLNIWTLDRADPPRFVPSIDQANDTVCKALIAVHCEGISKATTDDNHKRTGCQTNATREDVACWRTSRGASWWCCCCSASKSPTREGS